MIFENPIGAKITTLLVTRLLLFAGAVILQRKAAGAVSVGLIAGTSALVVSSVATFGLIYGVGPFRSMPNINPILQTLEIGGWLCFSVSFLILTLMKRRESQNTNLEHISDSANAV
jgi:hypothetical protein